MQKVYDLEDDKNLKTEMLSIASLWKPNESLAVKYLLDWKAQL